MDWIYIVLPFVLFAVGYILGRESMRDEAAEEIRKVRYMRLDELIGQKSQP